MYSAHLAAAKGLPYVFAHHFSGQGTAEALAVYRSEFRPSDLAPEPVTFLTVNAAVADTDEEAAALMLPNLHMMAQLRTGQPLTALLDLVEDAQAGLHPGQAIVETAPAVWHPATAARRMADSSASTRSWSTRRLGAPRHRPAHGPAASDARAAAKELLATVARRRPFTPGGRTLAAQVSHDPAPRPRPPSATAPRLGPGGVEPTRSPAAAPSRTLSGQLRTRC